MDRLASCEFSIGNIMVQGFLLVYYIVFLSTVDVISLSGVRHHPNKAIVGQMIIIG